MIRRVIGWALAVLCAAGPILGLVLSDRPVVRAAYPAVSRPPVRTDPIPVQEGDVDVNSGDAEELRRLYRVGDSIAALILAEREANGFFHYPEDLLTVRGIGPSTLSGFREDLDLRTPEPEEP